MKYSDRNLLENVEKQIDIYNNSPKTEDKIKNIIPSILESIAEKVQITIDYKTVNEEISTKTIEVVGVFF